MSDPTVDIITKARRVMSAMDMFYQKARTRPDLFAQLVMKDEAKGRTIRLAKIHRKWHELMTQHDRLILWSHPAAGKALDVSTPIPIPNGWTTMAALRVGDTVFDSKGKSCSVTFATEIQYGRAVYRVTFDDGESLLADADHQWIVVDSRDRSRTEPSTNFSGTGPNCQCGCGLAVAWNRTRKCFNEYVHNHHRRKFSRGEFKVKSTAALLDAGIHLSDGRSRWKIPVTCPVQFAPIDLPIDPYALGVWLGNGAVESASVTNHAADVDVHQLVSDRVGATPLRFHKKVKSATFTVGRKGSFRRLLRSHNLLFNKHIPAQYLVASEVQRRELLAGLLDTDGYAGQNGPIEFTSTSESLAKSVLSLVRSLGYKAFFKTKAATLYGKDCGIAYRVFFTAHDQVFYSQRKDSQHTRGTKSSRWRYIKEIERVESVPVKCISVDSPDQSYLAGQSFTVTHNTTQLIARMLYAIGNNTQVRICVLSNTHDMAVKIVRMLSGYIERSEELKRVFVELEPATPWTESALTVKRPFMAKEPTVQAAGVHGSILGSRIDLLVIDDILDWENCRTPSLRDKLWEWLQTTIITRLTHEAKVVWIGNAFHPEDAMHRFAQLPAWNAYRYPIFDAEGKPRWPEAFPLDRIENIKANMSPLVFAQQYLCVTHDDSAARFKSEWFAVCERRGHDKTLVSQITNIPPGVKIITGVDLAVSKKDSADLTVLFTIAVWPNGDREILNIQSGRWAGPDIVSRVIDTHKRFGSFIIVEDNAAQTYLKQYVEQHGIPVRGFTTTAVKNHPELGIESLAGELAMGRWIIPSMGGLHKEVQAWKDGLLYYDPGVHTSDFVMASYFAVKGIEMTEVKKARTMRLDLASR